MGWICIDCSKIFLTCLVVPIAIVWCKYLVVAEVSSHNVRVETDDLVCAHFNVSDGKSFDLFDGSNSSQGLETIHNTEKVHEIFESVEIKEGCAVRICVINFLNQSDPVRKRECYTLYQSTVLKYEQFFYIVTIRCSCQKSPVNCEGQRCDQVQLGDNECARLFVEQQCNECYFNSTSLSKEESLIPTNGFSTESFVVNDKCRLSIGVDKLNENPDFVYHGIHPNIQLNYVLRPSPSTFTCSCNATDASLNGTAASAEEDHPLDPLMIILVSSIPVLTLIGIVAVVMTWRRIRQIRMRKAESKVISLHVAPTAPRLQNSETNGESFGGADDRAHYVSIGFADALLESYLHRFEVSRDDVLFGRILDNGHYGKVYEGKLRGKDGSFTEVAIKESKPSAHVTYVTSLSDEIRILSYLGSHPNVVSILGACTRGPHERNPILVLELCSDGNLKSYLRKHRNSFTRQDLACTSPDSAYTSFESLSTASYKANSQVTILEEYFLLLLKWSEEIAAGMEFLTQKNIVHSDLAARNVLLNRELTAKVSDFGLSQRLGNPDAYVRLGEEYPLPIRWMSMESLISHRFTPSSDIWSYGIVLWEIFSLGDSPYSGGPAMTYSELVKHLDSNGRLHRPMHSTPQIYDIMYDCWDRTPSIRPTFSQLRDFFQELRNSRT